MNPLYLCRIFTFQILCSAESLTLYIGCMWEPYVIWIREIMNYVFILTKVINTWNSWHYLFRRSGAWASECFGLHSSYFFLVPRISNINSIPSWIFFLLQVENFKQWSTFLTVYCYWAFFWSMSFQRSKCLNVFRYY